MQELIPIQHSEGGPIVSARHLHGFLEVGTRFDIWMPRMLGYDFLQDVDYQGPILDKGLQDYALTLDTAKEIAMLQRTDKGKQARRYFIECEKQLCEQPLALPQTQGELILMLAQQNVAHEKRLAAVEQASAEQRQQVLAIQQAVEEVRAKQTTVPDDFYTVAGWASLQKRPVPLSTATALGKRAAALSKADGIPIGKVSDQRYGTVNAYHICILQKIIPID